MPRVALVTLGCARNEVDSEELAGRLDADGWTVVDDPGEADAVLVNTCGFVDAAKKDSIDTLLAAADLKSASRVQAVVAVGCLAERYGEQLAVAMPETEAVLGFDDYAVIGQRLRSVLDGDVLAPHTPRDRRTLLPLTPVERPATRLVAVPGHRRDVDLPAGVAPASGPRVLRRRLDGGPTAPLKLASGCDRRCSFCAIPSFRGAFLSRPPHEVVDEARWLAEQGVRELVLVSENSTSYGKDLGNLTLLEKLLPDLASIDGIERVRVSYLQPAEMRPTLIEALTTTDGVVPYFDLSFQHASGPVLRRMRRYGDSERFLDLLAQVRTAAPSAGVRSNVIVGFPGETEADLVELEQFVTAAGMDAVGVFGYSDEDGTEAATYDDKVDEDEIRRRVAHLSALTDELVAQRAEQRIGADVDVLVESVGPGPDREIEGRAAHQGPEVDGSTLLVGVGATFLSGGALVPARVQATDGVDLVARVTGAPR